MSIFDGPLIYLFDVAVGVIATLIILLYYNHK